MRELRGESEGAEMKLSLSQAIVASSLFICAAILAVYDCDFVAFWFFIFGIVALQKDEDVD